MISLSRALSFSSWQLCMAVVVGEMCRVALPPSYREEISINTDSVVSCIHMYSSLREGH